MDFKATFKIQKKFELCGESQFALTRLYLPLIGMDAHSLYIFLYALEASEGHPMKKIMDALNYPNFQFLEQALHKLEGIGLLDAFYHEEKGYYFQMKAPLNIASFFTYPVLEEFLIDKIGAIEVGKLKNSDQMRAAPSYKKVSKRFDEVYEIKEQVITNAFTKIFLNKVKSTLKLQPEHFDYILFKMSFDSDFIEDKILDDDQLKQSILNLAFTYKLTEEEMKEAVMNTIQLDNDLKIEDVQKHAKKIYQNKDKSVAHFVTKDPDVFVTSSMDESTYQLLTVLERSAPVDILQQYSNISPSSSELELMNKLVENTRFSHGVINLMIIYVLSEKKGELPSYPYFEKIANTWARKGVKNAKDALELINRENQEYKDGKNKSNAKQNKRHVVEPDWYKNYEEELKNTKKETLSQEEMEEAMQKAKELFK